jgi:hypothetical protein
LSVGYRSDGLRAWSEDGSGDRQYWLYDGNLPLFSVRQIPKEATSTHLGYEFVRGFLYGMDGLVWQGLYYGSYAYPYYIPETPREMEYLFYLFDPLGSVCHRFDAIGEVRSDDHLGSLGLGESVRYRTPPVGQPIYLRLHPFSKEHPVSSDAVSGWRGQYGYQTERSVGLVYAGSGASGGGMGWFDPFVGRELSGSEEGLLPPRGFAWGAGSTPYSFFGSERSGLNSDWYSPFMPFGQFATQGNTQESPILVPQGL